MATTAAPSPADRRAIDELLAAMKAAWDAGDAAAYANLFTSDASYVMFAGGVDLGREAIAATHVPVLGRWQRGSRMALRVITIQTVSADVAVVVSDGGIGKGKRIPLDKVQTFTLVRTPDGWRCAAFQNTKKRPILLRIMRASTPART